MTSKKITQSAINWSRLSERVPEHQKSTFQVFKAKSDIYLAKVLALPEKPPPINWNYYTNIIPISGLVDDFQKQYNALTIPYPVDTVSSQIDQQEKELKVEVEKFKADSIARVEETKKKLAHLASLLPFDQMTLEDYYDAFPEEAMDVRKRPTFWPHTREEQIDYVEDQALVDKP